MRRPLALSPQFLCDFHKLDGKDEILWLRLELLSLKDVFLARQTVPEKEDGFYIRSWTIDFEKRAISTALRTKCFSTYLCR